MPVFQLELQFNDKGAVTAARQLGGIAKAAGNVQTAVAGVGTGAAKATSQAAALGSQGAKAGSDISAAMKSAAKNVLALVGAYKAVGAVKGFVQRGVEMNAAWEQSKIGIASVIASVQQLENEQGDLLKGPEAYQAALGLAEQAMNRIKIMGLETTATTEDLVAGFQQLIGPAAAAGLSMEQTLQFTTSMVQSLGAIGIPFNQLSAEARSLLDGTIVPTQDRLATTLGITGDMVRNWKEQGVLAQRLLEKMSAFAAAGDDVARTWSGVKSNLQDAIDMVASVTSKGMYENLKESLLTVQGLLVSTEEGSSGVNDDFKNIADVLTIVENRLGGAILSGVKEITGAAKELNSSIGDTGAVVYLDDLTTALKTATAAVVALGIAKKAGLSDVRLKEPFEAATKSVKDYKAALVEAAQAELAEAKAAQRAYIAATKTAEWQKRAASSSSNLVRAREAEAEVNARVIAAEKGLAVALNTSTAAATRAGLAQKALTGIKNAFSGLMGFFGGPWGIALTGATAAITYLMTRQNEAARATEYHEKALKNFEAATKGATDETGKLTGKLTQLQKLRLEMAQKEASRAFETQITSLERTFDNIKKKIEETKNEMQQFGYYGNENIDIIPVEFLDNLDTLPLLLRKNIISADEFQERLAALRQQAIDAGYGGSEFVRVLEEMQQQGGLADKLAAIAKTLFGINDASRAAAGGVRVVTDAAAAANAKLADVLQKSSGESLPPEKALEKALQEAKSTKAGKAFTLQEQQQRNLAAQRQLESFIKTATDKKQIEQAQKALGQLQAGYSGLGESIASGASKVENAREKFAAFNREISQLQGKSSKSDASLEKKRADILEVGKSAGVSAEEIRKMQDAYSQAFQSNALNELNKQLLEAENNTEALQKVINAEKLQEFANRVNELKNLSPGEKKILTGRFTAALENQQDTKDLQARADFYKDFAEATGQYNTSLEFQNQLLERNRVTWDLLRIPIDDINTMLKIQRLEMARDPWSGMMRGMRKWSAESTNLAKGFETAFTSSFDSVSDALTDFVMGAEVNLNNLTNSILRMFVQIAAQQAVGGIVGGLASGLGSLFGSGGFSLSSGQSSLVSNVIGMGVGVASAEGNVFSGGNLSDYSGQIVTKPTLFGYDSHLSAFAHGAGLMGEAGPEAVMPLARMNSGVLGIRGDGFVDLKTFSTLLDSRAVLDATEPGLTRVLANFQSTVSLAMEQMRQERQAAYSRQTGQNEFNAMPQVNINIQNNAGAEVSQSVSQGSNGSLNIDLMLDKAVAKKLNTPGTNSNRALLGMGGRRPVIKR